MSSEGTNANGAHARRATTGLNGANGTNDTGDAKRAPRKRAESTTRANASAASAAKTPVEAAKAKSATSRRRATPIATTPGLPVDAADVAITEIDAAKQGELERQAVGAALAELLADAPVNTIDTGVTIPGATPAAPMPHKYGISPENTVFVSLCFEGPDIYSTAGGLGTRVAEFTESLAQMGYDTHLIFVGDPNKPAVEDLVNGRLHLKRWSQWISKYYPNGVYDGEEQKLYDYNESVPYHVYEQIARPAIEQGKIVVVIGEDWHTAEAVSRTSDLLHWHNLRHRAILMWNCNSIMSLHRINWGRLNFTSTITTVSRYMKHRLWAYDVNPLVIPNGIPRRYLEPVDPQLVAQLQDAAQRGDPKRLFLFKIGRFDPDKRWLMAIEAAARLKYSGHPVSMVIRGGIEPHGGEVLNRARHLGLTVRDVEARRPSVEECVQLLRDAGDADIYNLRFFVPEQFVRMCYAGADAVLANSGHEPFGLVGLEVMAAAGIAFTGSTGEDYALSFENAIALETEDPEEIVGYLVHLQQHPEEKEKIRAAGRRTAAEFVWEEAIDNLTGKLGYLARKQSIVLE
ncbi:MAG: glycosyltransferase [Ktedonobacterales bacterium]